jgi:hypothetical protein
VLSNVGDMPRRPVSVRRRRAKWFDLLGKGNYLAQLPGAAVRTNL